MNFLFFGEEPDSTVFCVSVLRLLSLTRLALILDLDRTFYRQYFFSPCVVFFFPAYVRF